MAKHGKKRRKNLNQALANFILGGGLILIAVAGLILALSERPQQPASQTTQEIAGCVQPSPLSLPAPSLELVDLEGNAVSLDGLRGEVVLLNTWASWCPPCRAEMPTLNAYYERHKDEGFTLVAVNIGESGQHVKDFASALGLTFPLWLDPQEESLRTLGMFSLPSSVVIDRSGQMRFAWTGATCMDVLESEVTPLLY